MNSIKQDLAKILSEIISKEYKKEINPEKIELIAPPSPEMGDFAFPVFSLAKVISKKPKEIAERLAGSIKPDGIIKSAEASGSYLNLTLHDKARGDLIEASTNSLLKSAKKEKGITMVEFFDANTHKAVHVGHVRNITLGEAISRLLERQGKNVVRVNYMGDIGPHVAKCIWGFMRLCGGGAALPRSMSDVSIPEELAELANGVRCRRAGEGQGAWLSRVYTAAHKASENDPDIAEEIREINIRLYAEDPELKKLWEMTRKWCLDDFDRIYEKFGVKFKRIYFESEVGKRGVEITNGLVKKGIAKESEGALIVDFSDIGLDVMVLVTGDGTVLYGAKELALAELKQKEYQNITSNLYVVAEEQSLHFKQAFEILKRMKSPLYEKSQHIAYGLVRLPEGKMSSREGTVVLYEDLFKNLFVLSRNETKKRHHDWSKEKIEGAAGKIALSAIKFEMLKVDSKKNIVFDAKRAIGLQGDTGPYLLYTIARINSILKKVKKMGSGRVDWSLLAAPEERLLQAILLQSERVVDEAASEYRPSSLIHHLLGLAKTFNAFYHEHKVLKAETARLSNARLVLVDLIGKHMQRGLDLLAIETLEEM